jgi:regulator of protease activity HflC (stomatin/prohibitin superfamily)
VQALIEFLLRQLKAFWPLAVVPEWQRAIRVRRGLIVGEVGPGLRWRWIFLEEIRTWPRSEVAIDLGTAAVTTTDGQSVAISANLGYLLVDMALCWRTLWSMESSLGKLALAVLASAVSQMSLDHLRTERSAAESELLSRLNAVAAGWGLKIVRLHLTDCVPLRAHRHYVDGIELGKG